MAFTSVCTAELCEMRDNLHTYTNLNAEILAVSVDSPFTLAKFKEEQNLPFPFNILPALRSIHEIASSFLLALLVGCRCDRG